MRRRRGSVLAAVLCLAVLPGCAGDVDINGAVGITVTADGTPVAVAEVCHGAISGISVAGPNRGTQPNEVLADLGARAEVRGSAQVDLVDPGAAWHGTPLALPLDDDLYIVIADDREANSQLRQADFTVEELAALTPGTVQYAEFDPDSERGSRPVRVPVADFADLACRSRG